MANGSICVRGNGVAALCCLQLLKEKGYIVESAGESRRLPAILLSTNTQELLADIFRSDHLFDGLPVIRERIVSWDSGEPIRLLHSGVVVSETVLLDRLRSRSADFAAHGLSAEDSPLFTWTILTSPDCDPTNATLAPSEQMRFGSRLATVREVELARDSQTAACWVESVADGWLFLLPIGNDRGSLISVSVGHDQLGLLVKSRLIAPLLQSVVAPMGTVESEKGNSAIAAYPRIAMKLAADGWLTCGSSAMTFDPLCGEGAGNAAREAILACASIQAIQSGEPAAHVLAEYETRLRLGFLRHLENCREFYTQTASTSFWSAELAKIDEGIAWTKAQLATSQPPNYRLVDFSLKRLPSVHPDPCPATGQVSAPRPPWQPPRRKRMG